MNDESVNINIYVFFLIFPDTVSLTLHLVHLAWDFYYLSRYDAQLTPLFT